MAQTQTVPTANGASVALPVGLRNCELCTCTAISRMVTEAPPTRYFVVVTEDEAAKFNECDALTLSAFEDQRMQYVCVVSDMQAALQTALRVKTKAAVQAASERSTWYVLEIHFTADKLVKLIMAAPARPYLYWCWTRAFIPDHVAQFHVYGDLKFRELASYSWSRFSIDPLGVGQLLRHTRFENIDEIDKAGRNALHGAAYIGYPALIEELLDQDILSKVNIQDKRGNSPLHTAVERYNLMCVKQFLKDERCDSMVELKNDRGRMALHLASTQTEVKILEALLEHPKADVKATDIDGHTPVHWAAWKGNKAAVEIFIKWGKMKDIADARNYEGKTASDIAEVKGYTAIAALLNCEANQ